MGNSKKNILGIFPSLGGSIESQRRDGREGLFLNYYLPTYLKAFDEILYFSYSPEKPLNNPRVHLCDNQKRIHRYLYAFLMPFIYKKELQQCQLVRVMHTTGAIPAVITKFLYRVPFVMTYGYNYVHFAQIEGYPVKAFFLKFFIPFFLKYADGIIVTTEELKREVERWSGQNNKIRLVPNGVDTSIFKKEEKKSKEGEVFEFLFVGRLEKQKNIPLLLKVISILHKKRKVKLTIVGSGSLERELKQAVEAGKLPVEFKGSLPYETIPREHADADCFISTSLAEGHPKALIEAMSSGLLCVVSSSPGNSGLIESGRTGQLIGLDQKAEEWARLILKLIDDPIRRQSMQNEARKFVMTHFDLLNTLKIETSFLNEKRIKNL